jgi:hypothetical protein
VKADPKSGVGMTGRGDLVLAHRSQFLNPIGRRIGTQFYSRHSMRVFRFSACAGFGTLLVEK